jgi:hypothetical protein
MSRHRCEYLLDWMLPQQQGYEGYVPQCECEKPASVKHDGKWYCEEHADCGTCGTAEKKLHQRKP